MEITYRGNRCLKLRGKNLNVLVDPPAKIPASLQSEIVVRTAGETDTAALRPHEGKPQLVSGPGEFEVSGVAIRGLSAAGDNTVMKVEVDEVRVVAVGNLTRQLTEDEIENLGHVDVLCIPVGENDGMTPVDATKLARAMEPAIVVPLAASSDSAVGTFAKEMGLSDGWAAQPKLNLTGSMPSSEEIRVVILEPRN